MANAFSLSSVSVRQNHSVAQLLAQVAEVETLSYQVLQWKDVGSSLLSDSS